MAWATVAVSVATVRQFNRNSFWKTQVVSQSLNIKWVTWLFGDYTPTVKVADETYRQLDDKRLTLINEKVVEQIKDQMEGKPHKRIDVTFDDVITQNFKDIETLNAEVTGLIKQLQKLGVRPYWTEEVKTE